MKLKVIVTGAQGLVGEGVLLKCLESSAIGEVLSVGRWTCGIKHVKLKELILPDLVDIDDYEKQLTGYHACFYCSRIIPAGLDDDLYAKFAIDPALSFASRLLILNPNIVFNFLSRYRNGTIHHKETKIDGMIESALSKLTFRKLFFFRSNLIAPMAKQNNVYFFSKVLSFSLPLLRLIIPNKINTSSEVGLAMINILLMDVKKNQLEVKDIRALAKNVIVANAENKVFAFSDV